MASAKGVNFGRTRLSSSVRSAIRFSVRALGAAPRRTADAEDLADGRGEAAGAETGSGARQLLHIVSVATGAGQGQPASRSEAQGRVLHVAEGDHQPLRLAVRFAGAGSSASTASPPRIFCKSVAGSIFSCPDRTVRTAVPRSWQAGGGRGGGPLRPPVCSGRRDRRGARGNFPPGEREADRRFPSRRSDAPPPGIAGGRGGLDRPVSVHAEEVIGP